MEIQTCGGKDAEPTTEPIEMELGPVRTMLFAAGEPRPVECQFILKIRSSC